MAFIQVRRVRYPHISNLQYIHETLDELKEAFEQVGIQATIHKFSSSTNLGNSSTASSLNIPSWVVDNANCTTWVVKSVYNSSSTSFAGNRCYGVIYWVENNIKYTYFMGGVNSSDVTSRIGDTLVQNLFVEGTSNAKENGIIGQTHDNYNDGYCKLGKVNVQDNFVISKSQHGVHFYVKGANTTSENFYAGHNSLPYQDSVVNSRFAYATKFPTHNNMGVGLDKRSLGVDASSLISPTDGDILTGKYFAFDVFYGVKSGTVIGAAIDVKCIPHLPVSLGEVASVGGEMYLRVGSVYGLGDHNHPLMVKVS